MQSKHTPGPWETHDNIGRKGLPGVVADAAPCIICVMGNSKEWPEEAEDNARLIAAAPDLLAACKRAKEILDSWGPERWGDTLERLHKRLSEAIGKAEGGA